MKTEKILPLILSCYLLFSMISISISQIFLFLSFLCWLYLSIKKKQIPCFPSFFWPLIVYSALSLVSSFFSVNPEVSLKDSRELLLFLIVPVTYVAFSSQKDVIRANFALFLSACSSISYSLFTFLFRASPGERIAGFMGHYMTQAGLMLLFCSAALAFFLFMRSRERFIWGIGLILATGALILTLTRSAWIGLAVASTILLLLYKPRALIIIPVALGLFFLLSPQYVKRRTLSIFSLRSSSNSQRIEYLNAGIKIIKHRPLFGTGPNTVDMVFQHPRYGLSESAKRNVHLHNNITQIGAERGIPTLLAWLTFMVWVAVSLIKLIRIRDPSVLPFSAAGLAVLCALATAGLFEYNFADSEITVVFLYFITLPFAFRHMKDAQGETV